MSKLNVALALSNIITDTTKQDENRKKIAANIEALMKSKGHDYKSFSELFCIEKEDAMMMLSGDYNYAINDLTMIATLFNVTINDLIR